MSKCQKRCQNVKKMSNVKNTDYGGGSQKKNKIHIMRFTDIDINFDVKYEGHQNCSKTLSMHILRIFGHHHMWHQNWRQYVWTSLCQFIFFVNLLHSPCVWLFDNLTSFWQLDIFLTTWHLFWHIGNKTHGQRGIMVNIEDIDGVPWRMGHMGDGAMGHMVNVVMCLIMCNFLNTAWIFTKILLDIYWCILSKYTAILPRWPFLSTKIHRF